MKWVLLPYFLREVIYLIGKGRVLELRPSGFKSQLCHLPAVWLWSNHIIFEPEVSMLKNNHVCLIKFVWDLKHICYSRCFGNVSYFLKLVTKTQWFHTLKTIKTASILAIPLSVLFFLFILTWLDWTMDCVFSHVWLFVTLWTVAHQAPESMEFFR